MAGGAQLRAVDVGRRGAVGEGGGAVGWDLGTWCAGALSGGGDATPPSQAPVRSSARTKTRPAAERCVSGCGVSSADGCMVGVGLVRSFPGFLPGGKSVVAGFVESDEGAGTVFGGGGGYGLSILADGRVGCEGKADGGDSIGRQGDLDCAGVDADSDGAAWG